MPEPARGFAFCEEIYHEKGKPSAARTRCEETWGLNSSSEVKWVFLQSS